MAPPPWQDQSATVPHPAPTLVPTAEAEFWKIRQDVGASLFRPALTHGMRLSTRRTERKESLPLALAPTPGGPTPAGTRRRGPEANAHPAAWGTQLLNEVSLRQMPTAVLIPCSTATGRRLSLGREAGHEAGDSQSLPKGSDPICGRAWRSSSPRPS